MNTALLYKSYVDKGSKVYIHSNYEYSGSPSGHTCLIEEQSPRIIIVISEGADTRIKKDFAINFQKSILNFARTTEFFSVPSYFERASVTDEVSITDSILNQIYQMVELGHLSMAVKTVFARIEGSFAKQDLLAVSAFLTKADIDLLPVRVLVAMLRSSSRAKKSIYGWNNLLERSISKADQEGLNTERLFWGLK